MLERSEKALRLFCLVLGAALLLQVVLKLAARNPVSGLKIPALPALSADAESGTTGKETNHPEAKTAGGPNGSITASEAGRSVPERRGNTSGTNGASLAAHDGGSVRTALPGPLHGSKETNSLAAGQTNGPGTNLAAKSLSESAAPPANSNTLARADSNSASTNSSRPTFSGKGTNLTAHTEIVLNGPHASARPGMGKRSLDLPLPIQARVDRVVDSELFGPVFHPMPEGLVGIAGNMAFLRAANGQTGAVKEGDELGGLKLLRIGINRVLVEEDGQQKELMIFQGLGGQSLLPK